MSLRARLLGAFVYVLLLAIVAFGVPLALSLSARVSAEVRTQAQAQADLVAATAGDLLGPASHRELRTLARTAAASLRGRVLVVNAGGRVLVDSAGGVEVGKSYYSRPEIKGALGGHQVQVQRASKTLGQEIPRDRRADHPRRPHGRRRARHPERLGGTPGGDAGGGGDRADRRDRVDARPCRGRPAGRTDRPAAAKARSRRAPGRAGRSACAGEGRGEPRAALAVELVQRDDRPHRPPDVRSRTSSLPPHIS